jgi:uncharacterized integral membrane protein
LPREGCRRARIYSDILLLFLAAVLLFAAQDTQTVTVQFLGWGMPSPLALLVIGVYVLGMLSGATVVGLLSRLLRRVTRR